MRSFGRFGIFISLVIILVACGQSIPQTASTPLPTLASLPIPTTTPTNSPLPTLNVTPTAIGVSPVPASIRIVNAAPNSPTLNIFVGIQAIATNLAFGQFTEPTKLDSGDYTLKILPVGASPSDTPLLSSPVKLTGDTGLLAIITNSGTQLTLTIIPDKTDPLNKGETIVHIIHALTGSGAITLQNGSSAITSAINFGQSASTAILPMGNTSLDFTSDGKKVANYTGDLKERTDYTLILAGQMNSPSIISFTAAAPGRNGLRVINASKQINSVDFYLDDMLLSSGVEYGRPTSRQNITSGSYTLHIYEAGADRSKVQPLFSQPISLEADQNTAVVFLGSNDQFTLLNYAEDLSPTPPNEARITFLNTLDNLNSIHLETTGGPIPGVPDLVYGAKPIATLLDSGNYSFYTTAIDQNGVNQTVENATDLQFQPGISYLYLITGRLDNNPTIVSENVGMDAKLANVPDVNGTPQLATQTNELRFINALQDESSIDFIVNGEVAAPSITAQQGSDLIAITDTTPTIQIALSGTSDAIAENDATLDENENYTIVAYGVDKANPHLLLIPDSGLVFDGLSPHVRLINLSDSSSTQLELGIVDATQATVVPLPPQPSNQNPFIPSVTQPSVSSIPGGSASSAILMPQGTFNLYIADSTQHEITSVITSLTVQPGIHYDVIAYQNPDATQGQAFVLAYPAHSD